MMSSDRQLFLVGCPPPSKRQTLPRPITIPRKVTNDRPANMRPKATTTPADAHFLAFWYIHTFSHANGQQRAHNVVGY